MLRALTLLIVSALAAMPAAATTPNLDALPGGGCPWADGIDSLAASMTTVYINGEAYYVKGYENRMAFKDYLRACDEAEAMLAFELWRRDRRGVNTTGIIGIVPALQPLWIGTAVFAVMAGSHKLQMLYALER